MKRIAPGLLLGLTLLPTSLLAQAAPNLHEDWVGKFSWRCIGPATMGGRIVALSVYEKDPTTFFVATASGGLLKTTNNGITFEHQFDKETTVSIGDVCMSQSHPDIVWLGTGEENPRNSVSYGDGVYKSVDGGKTWKNMGLEKTFQIGRVLVHPTDPDIVYVGALGRLYGPSSERGLFKTVDGGESWQKIHFLDDKTGVMDIQMHPKDPETLIFATYERQRDGFDGNSPAKKIAPGSGLWRTTDGGETFEKLTDGLPTVNMGRIGIDYYRGNPDIVYAIIESELIGKPGNDVGWDGLSVTDAETGAKVASIVKDSPAQEAGLKKDDIILALNGNTVLSSRKWTEGLTSFKVGEKVELEIARAGKSEKIELTLAKRRATPRTRGGSFRGFRGRGSRSGLSFGGRLGGQPPNLQDFQGDEGFQHGGIYRSNDGGSSWQRINSVNPRPMYFSQVRVDPSDNNHLYVLGISGYQSVDGGKTFTQDATRGVHSDHHALWIDPNNGRHMILGCDGGIYVTYDRTKNWDHLNHLALGQFYHVAVGPRRNYWVYGGLQDNGTWGAPHRSDLSRGTINEEWLRIGGGDGFVVQIDPEDPDQIYYESQNGATRRTNLRTRESGSIRPGSGRGRGQRGQRGSERGGRRGGERGSQRGGGRSRQRYRFNWKTPFILSSHNSRIYYNAGNYVFQSLDKGKNLKAISPEITRTERGSGSAVAESPLNPNVLYAGTTDGGLWGTQKGDSDWNNLRDLGDSEIGESERGEKERGGPRATQLTGEPVPFKHLVPKPLWVSSIEASRYREGRVYVTCDGHRSDDDAAYVVVSEDFGKTWTSLRANLPRGSTRCIREDRVNQNLLYLGTEFGLYISLNRGESWVRFHNNLPTVAIHEVAQHQSCGDIVLATHGRSLWSTNVSGLRQLTSKALGSDLFVCKPEEVIVWRRSSRRGSSGGARRFEGSNPSSQAAIFFFTEKKPKQLAVTIQDVAGKVVSTLKVEPAAGLNRVDWNLRRDPPPGSASGGRNIPSRFRGRGGFRGRGFGRSAPPGAYKLVVTADGVTKEATFKVSSDPRIPSSNR